MTSFTAAGDSCHVHSLLPLPASDQVNRAEYSESKVETDMAALQLETSMVDLELETDAIALELEPDTTGLELETEPDALDLEMEIDMPQETFAHLIFPDQRRSHLRASSIYVSDLSFLRSVRIEAYENVGNEVLITKPLPYTRHLVCKGLHLGHVLADRHVSVLLGRR
jgi:hypothetical protein